MESPLEEGGAPDILYPRRHLYPHPRDRQQKAGSTASRGRRARVTAALRRLAPRQMAGRSPATQPARQWGTLPGATRGDGFVPNRNPCPAALPAARLTGEQVRPPAVGPARWPGADVRSRRSRPRAHLPLGASGKDTARGGKLVFPRAVGRSPAAPARWSGGSRPCSLARGPDPADPGGEGGHAARRAGGLGCPLPRALAKLVGSRNSSIISAGTHVKGALPSILLWPLSTMDESVARAQKHCSDWVPGPDSGRARALCHLLTPTVMG